MTCWTLVLPFFLCGMEPFAPSNAPNTEAHAIIGRFAAELFVLQEANAASEMIWYDVEAASDDAMSALAEANPKALTHQTEGGITPLMLAAYHGHAHLVEALLRDPAVLESAGTISALGFSAADLAMLAYKQSERHCRRLRTDPAFPDFTPSLITLPYYQSRNPYYRIRTVFERKGILPDHARVHRLLERYCPALVFEADMPPFAVQGKLLKLSQGNHDDIVIARVLPREAVSQLLLLRGMAQQGLLPLQRAAACFLEFRTLGHLRPETRCHP